MGSDAGPAAALAAARGVPHIWQAARWGAILRPHLGQATRSGGLTGTMAAPQ
jgi:hypothetical protein